MDVLAPIGPSADPRCNRDVVLVSRNGALSRRAVAPVTSDGPAHDQLSDLAALLGAQTAVSEKTTWRSRELRLRQFRVRSSGRASHRQLPTPVRGGSTTPP